MAATNPFFSRKFNCPVCNTEVSTQAVRSSMVYVQKRESDFHTIYKDVSPLHYSIVVCPSCNYAASTNIFSKELAPSLTKQLGVALYKLKENFDVDFGAERDIKTVLKSFQLAVRSAQLKKVPEGELAGLLLATAWIAREEGNQEVESYYLSEALQSYLKAYKEGFATIGNLDDLQAAYLIGELHLRAGCYNESVNWFNQVIVHKNIRMHPVEEKLAREQWALARELAKNDNPESHENAQVVKEETSTEEIPNEPAQPAAPPVTKRISMQMNVNLYSDQIDWLSRVVNNGYNYSKKLITKEQVVRSILDAVIESTGEDIPSEFANENELKQYIVNTLQK